MILLTDNRNMKDEDSLAKVLRQENTITSLPVLTIGKMSRFREKEYLQRCILRLAEIISELDRYLGTGRLFIP